MLERYYKLNTLPMFSFILKIQYEINSCNEIDLRYERLDTEERKIASALSHVDILPIFCFLIFEHRHSDHEVISVVLLAEKAHYSYLCV